MDTARLNHLMDLYLDCGLTPDDKHELEQFVITSVEARKQFWYRARQHWMMREVSCEQEGRELAESVKTPEIVTSRRQRIRRIPVRRSNTFALKTAMAVAASVLIVIGLWFVVRSGQESSGLPLAELTFAGGDTARVEAGKEIVIPAGSSGVVRYPGEDTKIELSGGSIAVFRDYRGAKRIELKAGKIRCSVAPQVEGKPMMVTTTHAENTVLGTIFTVTVTEDHTRLEVTESAVRFVDRISRRALIIEAGNYAEIGPQLAMHYGRIGEVVVATKTGTNPDVVTPPDEPVEKISQFGRLLGLQETNGGAIVSFTLIDAVNNTPIAEYDPIAEGVIINLNKLPTDKLNVRANYNGDVQSVVFILNGRKQRDAEDFPPFAMAGDGKVERGVQVKRGEYNEWTPRPGKYTLVAVPYNGVNGTGVAGKQCRLTFTVIKQP